MKKFLIFVVTAFCAVVLMNSCSDKKSNGTPLEGLTHVLVFEKDGKYGAKTDNGVQIIRCEYDSITYSNELQLIVAKIGEKTDLFSFSGINVLSDTISSIELDTVGFHRVISRDSLVYIIASSSVSKKYDIIGGWCWGKMEDLRVVDRYLFSKSNGKWGVAIINAGNLSPCYFEKVYIVENGKTFGVLVFDKGWKLYNSDGVDNSTLYDWSNRDLIKKLKKFDVSAPYGVLSVDWEL